MKKGMAWFIGIAVFVIVVAMMAVSYHNKAVALDEKVQATWSQVLNQYKRRADLIPKVVNTVKGYATHEKEVLTQVTEARAKVGQMQLSPEMLNDPNAFAAFEKNQSALSSALSRLMLVVERYPDLKANQNFLMLQEELSGVESKIAYARQFYNDTVMKWNQKTQLFPGNVVAGIFGFKEREYFQIEEAARKVVKVKF